MVAGRNSPPCQVRRLRQVGLPLPQLPGGVVFRRMLEPRATYHPDKIKIGRGWWALFIDGIRFFGILGLATMIAVWSDKKFLKQMAPAVMSL